MAVAVYKTYSAGEVLTASDLNNSFLQIHNNGEDLGWPATQAKDLDGQELILDADADTSITADTDDQIDFKIAGSNLVVMGVSWTDFTNRPRITHASPAMRFVESGVTADNTRWDFIADAERLHIRTVSDDGLTTANAISVDRTGTVVDAVTIGGTSLDINGAELILDVDADTSITADTDDQIDFRIGAADRLSITSALFTFSIPVTGLDLNGSEFILDADADTSITADTDDQIDFKIGGTDRMFLSSASLLMATGIDLNGNNLILDTAGGSTITTVGVDIQVLVDGDNAGYLQPVVSGYQSGMQMQLNSDGGNSTVVDIASVVTTATSETVGDTAAAANNTWTALDSLPGTVSAILVNIQISGTSSGAGATSVILYANSASSTIGPSAHEMIANLTWTADAAETEVAQTEAWIPTNSLGTFNAYWTQSNTSARSINMYLKGWLS